MGLLGPDKVSAHCDGLDGPVVKAAQKALETGDINLVLIWQLLTATLHDGLLDQFKHVMATSGLLEWCGMLLYVCLLLNTMRGLEGAGAAGGQTVFWHDARWVVGLCVPQPLVAPAHDIAP
jgi:hypothetical protein